MIRYEVDHSDVAPDWPPWLSLPPGWSALAQVLALAAAVFAVGRTAGAVLNYLHAVASARLVTTTNRRRAASRDLREAARFEQPLLSHPLDHVDHQSRHGRRASRVRQFVEGMVLQMVILLLSLTVYLTYMLRIHAGLSLACLLSMPVLWLVAATFCGSCGRPTTGTAR